MRRGREHRVETGGHRYAAVKTLELRSDLTLIVIHRDDTIILAREGFQVDRVGWKWPTTINSAVRDLFDGRRDEVDFITPEQAILSRMRIECCDRHPRSGNSGLPHDAVR